MLDPLPTIEQRVLLCLQNQFFIADYNTSESITLPQQKGPKQIYHGDSSGTRSIREAPNLRASPVKEQILVWQSMPGQCTTSCVYFCSLF